MAPRPTRTEDRLHATLEWLTFWAVVAAVYLFVPLSA